MVRGGVTPAPPNPSIVLSRVVEGNGERRRRGGPVNLLGSGTVSLS